jgi:HK97 family phage major capsid protein
MAASTALLQDILGPIRPILAREDVTDLAVKSWYVRKYGEPSRAASQVSKELYGADLHKVSAAKNADFVHWLRTGKSSMHRTLVYSGNQIDEMIASGAGVAELKATQIESQDVLGGYLVGEDMREQIVLRLAGMTVMRRVGQVMTTTMDRVTMPVQTGGNDRFIGATRANWVDEVPTAGQAETTATFGNITIPVHTLMAHTAISKNLLEDSVGALNIVNIITNNFAEDFGLTEDEAFFVGNGVAKPQGILVNSTTGGPNTFSYGNIGTFNTGAATALTADAFKALPYVIASQYRQAGGTWIMSRGTVRAVKSLKDGAGNYLWSDRINQMLAATQPRLEGYEIMETEVLASPTTGSTYTANVHPVLFVTPGSYQIIDRAGMDVMRYDDSTTATTNSVRLVARRRVGGQVIRPWGIAVMKVSA